MKYLLIMFVFLCGCNYNSDTIVISTTELETMLKQARGSSFALGVAVAQSEIMKKRDYFIKPDSLEKICIGELSKMNIRQNYLFWGERK